MPSRLLADWFVLFVYLGGGRVRVLFVFESLELFMPLYTSNGHRKLPVLYLCTIAVLIDHPHTIVKHALKI